MSERIQRILILLRMLFGRKCLVLLEGRTNPGIFFPTFDSRNAENYAFVFQ